MKYEIGTALLTSALLYGCSTTPTPLPSTPPQVVIEPIQKSGLRAEPRTERTPKLYALEEAVMPSSLARVTHDEARYLIESPVLWGRAYEIVPNLEQKENELEFMLKARDETSIVRKRESGKIESRTESLYIPTIEINSKGKPMSRIGLLTAGPNAIKAKVKEYNISRVESGILTTTNEDVEFEMLTQMLNGKEYFFPRVCPEKEGDSSKLPFYLIKGEEAKIITNQQGQITIENPGRIFRPIKISLEDYKKRTEERISAEVKRIEEEEIKQEEAEQSSRPKPGTAALEE